MGLPTHRMLSAFIELPQVMNLQIFEVNFKQNIESQHQCALASVSDTRITSAGLAVGAWVEIDFHRSVMKKTNNKNHI